MHKQIHKYVAECDTCQRNKTESLSPVGLLQPLPIPCQVWDDISLDFIEGLLTSGSKNSILVIDDHLSKAAHFLALSHSYATKTIAEKFIKGIVKLNSMP